MIRPWWRRAWRIGCEGRGVRVERREWGRPCAGPGVGGVDDRGGHQTGLHVGRPVQRGRVGLDGVKGIAR